MTTMQLELPEDVAERMRDRGMLNPEGVTAILRDAMTRREEAFDFLLALPEKLEAAGISFTEDEIAEEIRAYREERAAQCGV